MNAKADNGFTSLHYAILFREVEIIKTLILAEANINAKTANAETSLHIATSPLTSKSTVEQLIVNGAELNAKDINGRTPLHTAVNNGNVETVDLLIANGGGECGGL